MAVVASISSEPTPPDVTGDTGGFIRWRTENRSDAIRPSVSHAANGKKVITLLDDDRSETYATLDEAIRAAQTWYLEFAGGKLPIWNYRVESLPEFRRAIGQYKAKVAQAVGCRANRLKLRVEAPAGSLFFRHH